MQENVKLVTVKKTVRQAYRTEPIWQYDVGHVLNLEGFDNLPETFQMHYSRSQMGDAITQIGQNGQVVLPDEFAQTSTPIFAWVYVAEDDAGLTKYTIEIPVMRRARITDQEPTPVEQSAIDQAISALNAGVSRAETAAANAESSEDAASASAESAYRSSEAAAGAAESAAGDATAAGRSATAAGESASAAAASAANASGSATTAGNAATAAQGSASAASGSATAAGQSATAAAGSAAAAAQTKTEIDDEVDGFQAQLTNLSSALNQKQDAPAEPGTAGQVLGLDANLDPAWVDQTGDVEADGTYEDLTAGNALEVLSDRGTADAEPYLFRKAVGWNRAKLNAVVGGTVAWNQRVGNGVKHNNVTATRQENGRFILSGTPSYKYSNFLGSIQYVLGHRYLAVAMVVKNPNNLPITLNINNNVTSKYHSTAGFYFTLTGSGLAGTGASGMTAGEDYTGVEFIFNIHDITQMFGSAIADYFLTLEQASAGSAIALFRSWFPEDYYAYNPGELISVSGVQSRDTVGFNQFDQTKVVSGKRISGSGNETAVSGYSHSDYIPVMPNAQYYTNASSGADGYPTVAIYDALQNFVRTLSKFVPGTFATPENAAYVILSTKVSSTPIDTLVLNLSDTSRNGTYKPYVKRSYPLDSSMTLRGIPKLVDNKITFDGDRYLPDGTVERRYGVVDLGTLNWAYNIANSGCFSTGNLASLISTSRKVLCEKYITIPDASSSSTILNAPDKSLLVNKGTNTTENFAIGTVIIKDSAFTDPVAFKAAMSGVYLVYELATPTTETAEPYRNLQIQEKGGTEEFVSNAALPVPVGHDTFYPVNVFDYIDQAIAAALNS